MIAPPSDYMALESGHGEATGSAPWDLASLDFERRDSWLLSYIDILTLFLTMMAMLLALTPNEGASFTEPKVEANGPDQVSLLEADGTDLELFYPFPDLWPDLSHLLDKRRVHVDMSLSTGFPEIEKNEVQGSLSAQPQTAAMRPEAAQTQTPVVVPKQSTAPEDRLMQTLAASGLSERLQARKVDQSVHLQVHDNILFAPGSADLTSEGRTLLDDLAEVFGAHECTISVAGHTDNQPIANIRYASNWELSAGRATVVTRYLIDRGYDPARLRAIGYADTQPLAANDTPDGRARNRRVSLVVQFPQNEGQAKSQLTHHQEPVRQ